MSLSVAVQLKQLSRIKHENIVTLFGAVSDASKVSSTGSGSSCLACDGYLSYRNVQTCARLMLASGLVEA